ncbi:dhhc zinc finger domain-containing protein [Cystoisospora suis]|uniref:Palmitoyltransferase n=1 Tax=Cystoisospora suis TaxID=483139 RepID=A0A2C6KSM1_9APIC|nr:dhhc zinc finger domain-containing protein [Cystoisospora suis]
MEVVESIDMNRLCRTCWLYRSKRTKHCSICDVCIDGFDHHCMWLDNCIGIFNSRIFTVWILFHAITQLSHFFCCLLILFFLKTEEPRDFSDPAVVILPSSSSSFLFSSLIGERFLLVSLISLHVFTLYHLAALVYRQLRNIARNVTSDEVLNGSRYSTGNEKEVEMCTRTSLLKGSEKGGERKRRSFSHLPSFHREGGRRKDLWSLNQSFAGKAMIWRNCKSFWCDRRPRAILSDGSVSQALIELKDPQRHLLLLPSTSSSSFVSSLADLEKKKKKMTEKEKKTKRKKHFSVAYICMLMLSPVTSCVSFMKSFFFSSSFSSSSHLPSSSSSSLGRREKKCGKEVVIMMYRSLKRSCLSSSFCVRSLSFISSFFHSSPKLSRFFRRISRHLRSSSSFSSSPLSQDSKSTSSSSLSSTDLLLFASSSSSPSSSSSSSFFSLLKTCPCRRHRKDSLSSSSSLPFNVQRQQEQETYALNEVKKTACKQTLPKSVEVYSSSSFSSSSPSSFHEDGFRDDCIEEQE